MNPGNPLVVDKGFTIQHLLLRKQATIFIQPFLEKRGCIYKRRSDA